MEILVTNDDGGEAKGIQVLAKAAEQLGRVTLVAPEREQSASSHAVTLRDPLRIREVGERRHLVSGTPTDCVLLSIRGLLDPRPDLVLSGVNHGPNMGDDVTYSGTVAAAIEAALLGVPAIAFSLSAKAGFHFETPARWIAPIARRLIEAPTAARTFWNVNFPVPEDRIRGIRATRLGTRIYKDSVVRKTDPRGRDYYWIGGGEPSWEQVPETDFHAVQQGYISVTPIRMDLNDYEALRSMEDWKWKERE